MSYAGMMTYVKHAEQSLPTKLFDYFSNGLPVISSLNNEELKEIITYRNTGLFYTAEDTVSFYTQCKWLYEHPDIRNNMSYNARQFHTNHGNSEKIYSEYKEYIKKMIHKRQ